MAVKIQSGNSGSGSGVGGVMDIFKMFGGGSGSSSPGAATPSDPTAVDPTTGWSPQKLQQPGMGSQYGGQGLEQTGAGDPFMQSLNAMGRRQTQISSGKNGGGGNGLSSIASLASLA